MIYTINIVFFSVKLINVSKFQYIIININERNIYELSMLERLNKQFYI